MKIAIASCWKYRDTWYPFFRLFDRFWPSCPYPLWLLTDQCEEGWLPYNLSGPVNLFVHQGSWCGIVQAFMEQQDLDMPILLMQDDFFMREPVHGKLIVDAVRQMRSAEAGCVRLYPCPGPDMEFGSDNYGAISRDSLYRISCQAAIWSPFYLKAILRQARIITITDFELLGTPFSRSLPFRVLSAKREVRPWPMDYLCTAVLRGEWNPDAKLLCEREGILDVDWSMRPFSNPKG